MTEQEAEALVERLARIWAGKNCRFDVTNEGGFFKFEALVDGQGREFEMGGVPHQSDSIPFITVQGIDGKFIYQLRYRGNALTLLQGEAISQLWEGHEAFAAQWSSLFRRGCWLSGCDVEASPHEKAEWMQGFSREEIEAWNLKM